MPHLIHLPATFQVQFIIHSVALFWPSIGLAPFELLGELLVQDWAIYAELAVHLIVSKDVCH